MGTICLDVANGYSESFVATVKEARGMIRVRVKGRVRVRVHVRDLCSHGQGCARTRHTPTLPLPLAKVRGHHPPLTLPLPLPLPLAKVRGRHPTHTIIAGNVVRTHY